MKLQEQIKKNTRNIKNDRADIIIKNIQQKYKRQIEDLQLELEELKINQNNNFDIHSDSTEQIVNPKNIKTDKLVKDDIEAVYNIRNLELKIELLEKRYEELF